MFDCFEYLGAVSLARKLSTQAKKVTLEYAERSQTTPRAYKLKIHLDRKWSSSDASIYLEGTVTQRSPDGEPIFSGEIQEIDSECGEILVIKNGDVGQPLLEFPLYLHPVDYYEALEKFSRGILPEEVSWFELMPKDIREGKKAKCPGALDKGLRAAQKEALHNALTRNLSFIWGPPGTGKSYTLGRIVANFRAQKKRVLLLSTTNVAVDVATFSVDDACTDLGMPLAEKELVRLVGNLSNIEEFRRRPHLCSYSALLREYDMREQDLEKAIADLRKKRRRLDKASKEAFELNAQEKAIHQDFKSLGDRRRRAIAELVDHSKILAVTFTSAIFRSVLQSKAHFDAIVVDEASQISLAAWIYLTYKHAGCEIPKIVVAGDPLQLQPIAPSNAKRYFFPHDEDVLKKWFGKSIYSHVGLSSPSCHFPAVTFLDEQSRMHREICEAVSRTYYANRLCGNATSLLDKNLPPLAILKCKPMRVYEHKNSNSAEAINAYVGELVAKYEKKKSQVKIRVLSAYRNQRELLATLLCSKTYPKNIQVEVSTVHTSQGSEADIVIFDISDEPDSWFVSKNDDAKYMWCVAVSRSKNQCVLALSDSGLGKVKNPHIKSLFKNSTIIDTP